MLREIGDYDATNNEAGNIFLSASVSGRPEGSRERTQRAQSSNDSETPAERSAQRGKASKR